MIIYYYKYLLRLTFKASFNVLQITLDKVNNFIILINKKSNL
jgi:hypothetical protein